MIHLALLLPFLPLLVVSAAFLWMAFTGAPGSYFNMQMQPAVLAAGKPQRVRAIYLALVAAVTVVGVLCVWMAADTAGTSAVAVPVQTVLLLLCWAWGWNRLVRDRVPHAVTRSALLAPPLDRYRELWMTLLAVVPLSIAALYLHAHFEEIPLRFGMHYDVNSRADNVVGRSFLTVYGPLFGGVALVALLAAIGWVLPRVSASSHGGPAVLQAARRGFAGAAWYASMLSAGIALLPFASDPAGMATVIVGCAFVLAVVGIGALLVTGFQANRTQQNSTSEDHWKGGVFYYNAEDAALFVAKRSGLGYTLNMARPAAWVMVAVLLCAVVATEVHRHR